MTVRRILDPEAAITADLIDPTPDEKAQVEEAMRSVFGPEKRLDMDRYFEERRDVATTSLHLTDGKFIELDASQQAHLVFWVPMEVTDRAGFLRCLPVLRDALDHLGKEAADWYVWGFGDEATVRGWQRNFGEDVVSVAEGDSKETPEGLPLVGNTWRAWGNVAKIQARIGELLA